MDGTMAELRGKPRGKTEGNTKPASSIFSAHFWATSWAEIELTSKPLLARSLHSKLLLLHLCVLPFLFVIIIIRCYLFMGHITASNFFCGFGRCSIAMEAIDYASLLEKNKKKRRRRRRNRHREAERSLANVNGLFIQINYKLILLRHATEIIATKRQKILAPSLHF